MQLVMELGRHKVILDSEVTYMIYGDDCDAQTLMDMDFSHLNWLDERMLAQSITLRREVPILFHPQVVESLENDFENSPYWQKNRYEALAVFRRIMANEENSEDKKIKRAMAKPVDVKSGKYAQKKFRVVNLLVDSGYDREDAKNRLNKLIVVKTPGVMNLSPDMICKMIDDAREEEQRNIAVPKKLKYFTKNSQEDCIVYYVKFTHNETGESFKKIGITTRELRERFVEDIKFFAVEVLHTVKFTAERAQEVEASIKEAFAEYAYEPKTKLKKGGNTECFRTELDDSAVIKYMGHNLII